MPAFTWPMLRRMLHFAPLVVLAGTAVAHDWNGIARAKGGALFVVDGEDGQIWKVSPRGKVAVFVTGKAARPCNSPHHLAVDGDGVLWLAGG